MNYQWHITDECDQRCKHCYIWNENYKRTSMDFEQMVFVVDKVLQFDSNPYFIITGGDALLNKDFWKLCEVLKSKNLKFRILGNPFHLTDEVCRRLYKYGCEAYQLSVDGLEPTHDKLRMPGSFKATMDVIPMLKRNGIEAKVMYTVSAINIDELSTVLDLCVKAGVDSFSFARYCPVGKDKTNGITPTRYKKLLEDIDKQNEIYIQQGWYGLKKKDHLWLLHEAEKVGAEEMECDSILGCGCGLFHLTICPNGDIMACRRMPDSIVGNIFTDNLCEVWFSRMNAYRQYDRFDKCSKCFLQKACRGCPAVARCTNGSFYAADPQCWKEL